MSAGRVLAILALAVLALATAGACLVRPAAPSPPAAPDRGPVPSNGQPVSAESVLTHLAVPRPNHSPALAETAAYLKALLTASGAPFVVQEFPLHYHMMLLVGAGVFALAVVFLLLLLKQKPRAALLVALLIPLLLATEIELAIPVLSGALQKTGENIIITHTVADPQRELIFAAHYDSKSDFWDHIERARIYALIPAASVAGILLAGVAWLGGRSLLRRRAVRWAAVALAGLIVLYWGLILLGFGGYIILPPARQSAGVVDDGAAVAALLLLSQDIQAGKVNLGESNVTIVLTAGEEVTMQGGHWFVREHLAGRDGPALPMSLVNLEFVGQDGEMFYWEKDGLFVRYYAPDAGLVERVDRALAEAAGQRLAPGAKNGSDAWFFMQAGIPAITISNTGLPGLGVAGFHTAEDNLERANIANLELTVRVLERYIEGY